MSTAVINNPIAATDVAAETAGDLPAHESVLAIAAKLGGTPTRYTPPICQSYSVKCTHAATYHVATKIDLDKTLRFFGMTRRADGSAQLSAPTNRRQTVAPVRTRENVAACAAVGLSFWSEAPVPNGIWAVDSTQRAHLVKVDRRAHRAYVACMDGHSLDAAAHICQYRAVGDQTYTVPASNDEMAALLEYPTNGAESVA
ncbi:MAG: hypothetical protein AB7G47_19290 [Mycolicibacterium sp.]|uniref:DUF7457 domain-containing protein n=1 Tax=Mycolicibacterium sp. TaxID=2320850 RepID=UPI003D125E57